MIFNQINPTCDLNQCLSKSTIRSMDCRVKKPFILKRHFLLYFYSENIYDKYVPCCVDKEFTGLHPGRFSQMNRRPKCFTRISPHSPPLPLLPSIIMCDRCYWSCLGILRDLRWDLFLPNTIMLINSCFGDLPPSILSGRPNPARHRAGGERH